MSRRGRADASEWGCCCVLGWLTSYSHARSASFFPPETYALLPYGLTRLRDGLELKAFAATILKDRPALGELIKLHTN